jgi:hypothetical protein
MTYTHDELQMAQQFATTFATASGQAVLKELDRMYYGKNMFVADDPFASHVNIGAHMVVAAIHQLIALAHDPRTDTYSLEENHYG